MPTCVISLDTQRMSRHARSHYRCRPCSRAAQLLLLPPPGIWASIPLIPGLSDSPSQIPITNPPRMARQLHSKPMKMGLAPLPFLSLRLLVCFFPPALLVTNTRPASAMLVVSRRAFFMLRCRRCAATAALPKLPKLQNTSQLLTPPRIEADYSIKR